jgi:uncharacterized protein (DUF433 family)
VPITRLQRRREQPADHVEELRREHDARELDQARALRLVEARRDQRREQRHADPQEDRQHAQQHGHEARDRAEGLPALLFLPARQVAAEDRDEHDRERPAGQEVVQEVRHDEGRPVRVRVRAGAQHAADDRLAPETDQPRQRDREAPDEARLGDRARHGRGVCRTSLCATTEEPEPARGSLEAAMDWRERITIESGKRSGKPCIRGLRITVYDVLEYLASGMSEAQILEEFPDLEPEDLRAVYAFAADRERKSAQLPRK